MVTMIFAVLAIILFFCLFFWVSLGAPGMPEKNRNRTVVAFFSIEAVALVGIAEYMYLS
jgi:heme A synthase